MPQSTDYDTDNLMLFTRYRLRGGQQSALADSAILVAVGLVGIDGRCGENLFSDTIAQQARIFA